MNKLIHESVRTAMSSPRSAIALIERVCAEAVITEDRSTAYTTCAFRDERGELALKPEITHTPFNTAEYHIRKHLRWYLKKTNRSALYPKFSHVVIIGLVHDTFSRAGANMYGIWHQDTEKQRDYISQRCKTRVSRLAKFCHADLIEWFISERVMRPKRMEGIW